MSILQLFNLENKVAIVTGASTGLGQAIAIALAEANADIIGVGTKPMPDTQRKVEALGRRFKFIQADLIQSSVNDLKNIVDEAKNTFGSIDILINNAGIIRRENAIDFTEKDWDDVLDINLKSIFFLSQAFAKQLMKDQKPGKIVSIASMLSYQGGIRVPSYTASKSGLKGLTMALANEWSKFKISVNAIAPGYMITNNTEALRNDPVRNQAILDRIPLGRWGIPKDLAGAVLFLSSEASDYVQGITLPVDGGWLSR
jgi:2-dehydro-3-deoxy-D-gluconate 5-dehydrogenase